MDKREFIVQYVLRRGPLSTPGPIGPRTIHTLEEAEEVAEVLFKEGYLKPKQK